MEPISDDGPIFYANNSPYVEDDIPIWDTAANVGSFIRSFIGLPFSLIHQGYSWWNGHTQKPRPPSAPGHALVGSLPELCSHKWDLLRFVTKYQAAFGKSGFCELRVGTKIFYIVSDPIIARDILLKPKDFPRGESLRIWRKFSADGLSEGTKTEKFRSQAQQSIGQEHFGFFFPSIGHIARIWMQRLEQLAEREVTIDLMAECERVTLAALGESLLKRNPHDLEEPNPFNLGFENDQLCTQFLASFHSIFALICNRASSPLANFPVVGDSLYAWQYEKEEREFESAKSTLYAILQPIYSRLLSNPEEIDTSSKFYKLLQIFEIDIFHPNYDQMIDSSVGFIQASFETSSKALAWTLHLLARYPAIQKRLRSELQTAFRKKPPTKFEELQQATYLFQVIEESLRLHPPFPFLLRDVVNAEKFDHFAVQQDGTFLISPLLVHRNEKYWGADCESFKPERWTEEMLKDKWQLDHPEYLSFLGGIHRCPGRFFAKQELSLLLTQFLLQFNISHDPNTCPIELEFCVTLQSKHPICVRLDKIENAALDLNKD